jgi:putative transposase
VARKPRDEIGGGLFHVYARGNDKGIIYRDDADRDTYLRVLGGTVRHFRWRLLAYCLMPNHVHLLVQTPGANLGDGMRRLHGSYVQRFHSRHGTCGHLFQGRFGAVPVESDEQLWTVVAYIAMNPVKAGLCRHADDWPWGSHRQVLDETAPDWMDMEHLLGHFAVAGGEGRRRYTEFLKGQSP